MTPLPPGRTRPEPEKPTHCWCGGVIVTDENGNRRCSNADPNEVGP